MKALRIILLTVFTIAVALFSACNKDNDNEKDYRDKWIGSWEFTTIDYIRLGVYPPYDIVNDTTHFIGSIEKLGENRLKIVFKHNAIPPDKDAAATFPAGIYGMLYPIVNEYDSLTYPELKLLSHGGFTVFFSNGKMNIYYSQVAGHFGVEYHDIQGKKIIKNKKYEKINNVFSYRKCLYRNGTNSRNRCKLD